MTIRIMGACDGEIGFINEENGTECVLTGLDQGSFASGEYLEVDGERMTVRIRGGAAVTNGCAYHDKGYIALTPNRVLAEAVEIVTTAGSTAVAGGVGAFTQGMVGAYLWLDGRWKKLVAVADEQSATVDAAAQETGTVRTTIATMNTLTMTGGVGATLTKLEFDYVPRVR